MFNNKNDQYNYIVDNYPEVTDQRIDEHHWDLYCPQCKNTRGFQVVQTVDNGEVSDYYGEYCTDNNAPRAIYFRCPVCKAFKQWVIYKITKREGVDEEKLEEGELVTRYYRVASLPSDGLEDIDEIPPNPPELRVAYKQAIRAMNANAHIAAAAMFRRALQVITRNILNTKPGNLGVELQEVIGKKYNSVTITNDFSDNAYVIREVGNQGAHPDQDPDLLDFTEQDAKDLQKIFLELITDLFVVPEATRKAREEFLKRRKIQSV